jgi:hypothetical protein
VLDCTFLYLLITRQCCVYSDTQTSVCCVHKNVGDSGEWMTTTQSQGIKQAGEPQVVFVCADVWVISLNYTWPQFARRLLFTRLNFRSQPNVKVLVPASGNSWTLYRTSFGKSAEINRTHKCITHGFEF